jgi:hypothetical protein
MGSSAPLNGPRVDALLLADFAQSINGKLYIQGGGFTAVFVTDFRLQISFYFGALLIVPWEDTNRHLPIEGFLETVDGERVDGYRMHGDVEAGRPPGVKLGTDAVVAVAGPVQFTYPKPDDLLFVMTLGKQRKATRFSLTPLGGYQMQSPPTGLPPINMPPAG